jgi:hypothetical protein
MQNKSTLNLIKLLKEDKIIPFIGAGVSSATANVAGWENLILQGVEYAREKRIDTTGLIQKVELELESKDFLEASNYLKQLLNAPGFPFINWINESFEKLEIKDKDLISNILDLCAPIILTTNYDTLITSIDNITKRQKYIHNENDLILKAIKDEQDLIVHLHGIYEKPESIILSGQDYDALNKNDGYKFLLKKLFSDYHILFIGCSKDGVMDKDFSTIFNFIKEWFPYSSNQHFILLHEKEIEAQNHVKLLTECNIDALSYGNDYKLLSPFIKSINPNIDKRKIQLNKFKTLIDEKLKDIDLYAENSVDEIKSLIKDNFNSKYDWIDSEKMKVFESALKEFNNGIIDKKGKLIFIQNIIKSIVNASELNEKIELWISNRDKPQNLNPLNFITTSIISYECLLKIPGDIIEDLKYYGQSGIHSYFFDNYLGKFVVEIKNLQKLNIDLVDFYKDNNYLFENLKRIIDSLNRFLQVDPEKFYETIDKASITKVLPDKFLVIVTNEIKLVNENNLEEIYAKLPLEKNFSTFKVEVIQHKNQTLIIGANNKYCYYWNPTTDILSTTFFMSEGGFGIDDFFCKIVDDTIIIEVKYGNKLIIFNNFIEESTLLIDNNFSQLTPLNKGYLGCLNKDSTYKKDFLFIVDTNGKSKPILSIEKLTKIIESDKNLSFIIKDYYSKESGFRDFLSIIDNFSVKSIEFYGKEIFIIKSRFLLDNMTSLLMFITVDSSNKIDFLQTIHLDKTVCSSFDYYINHNNILSVICGYYDMNRDENMFEKISLDENYKVNIETIKIKREDHNVRDTFSVEFIDENNAITLIEGKNILKVNLNDYSFKKTDFDQSISCIKYYNQN